MLWALLHVSLLACGLVDAATPALSLGGLPIFRLPYERPVNKCTSDLECPWGSMCKDSFCLCPPGFGNQDCSFNRTTLYGRHDAAALFSNPQSIASLAPEKADFPAGWLNAPAQFYHDIVFKANASTIIEVGVWKGSSSRIMASALRERGGGVLIAIDTWLGSPEMWLEKGKPPGQQHPGLDLYLRHGYPTVFYEFLYGVQHADLSDYVIPLAAPSTVAFEILRAHQMQADLIHIDAAHYYLDVCIDISLYYSLLRPGGILVGDDHWKWWPGVEQAVKEFTQLLGLELHLENAPKWWIQKPLDLDEAYRPHTPPPAEPSVAATLNESAARAAQTVKGAAGAAKTGAKKESEERRSTISSGLAALDNGLAHMASSIQATASSSLDSLDAVVDDTLQGQTNPSAALARGFSGELSGTEIPPGWRREVERRTPWLEMGLAGLGGMVLGALIQHRRQAREVGAMKKFTT